ncbi:lipopolysaccharide biosynthesis protein [Gallaecimonas xiamenensis]|uniref:Polysaccharide biosynthesis protein n=1 Tax=Gallaecimonas xiamenensis 3-C-1 TaxID=745411 RepID=K2IY07_9GAMM|nr:oligosaccharide flippase family protein [Gallaecimonas xiamenensis]EKE75366.1 polysaccharide biosynthesis protein [Gallaecimonas xiamenensis 3-C-1]
MKILARLLTYGVSEVLNRLAPIITSFILAKKLGAESFGELSLIVVGVEILFIFISNNIQAVSRIEFFKRNTEEYIEFSKNAFCFSFFVFFFSLLLIGILSLIEADASLLLLPCIALFRSMAQFYLSTLQCSKESWSYFKVQITFILVFFVSFSLTLNYGIYSWILSMLIAVISQAIIGMVLVRKKTGICIFPLAFHRKLNWSQVKFGYSFMPQALGWWMKSGLDRYIISFSYGLSILGKYSLSYQFASSIMILVSALNLTIVPEINSLIKQKKNLANDKVNKIYFASFTLIVVSSLAIYFLSTIIIEYYFQDYDKAISYLPFPLISLMIQASSLIMMNELYFRDHGWFVARLVFLNFLLQGVLSFLLSKSFGIEAVLINSILFNLVLFTFVLVKVNNSRAI